MDAQVAQTPTVAQRTAFERVFGCRYVKSTVCRHRGVWKKADQELIDRYVAMGAVETAVWGEFVRQVEGRPAGKIKLTQSQLIGPGSAPINMIHNAQSSPPGVLVEVKHTKEEDEAVDELMSESAVSLPDEANQQC
jgi:hypothetical protein